jgi:hypothetical protein
MMLPYAVAPLPIRRHPRVCGLFLHDLLARERRLLDEAFVQYGAQDVRLGTGGGGCGYS